MMFINAFEIEINRANVRNAQIRLRDLWDAQKERKNHHFYQALCETVMWIDISNEWFFKNDEDFKDARMNDSVVIEEESVTYKDLICGIKFIFNTIKHNMDITNISKTDFKELGNNLYLEKIIFLPVNEIEVDEKYKNKEPYKAYVKYLQNKTVLEVLTPAVHFLNHYFNVNKNKE